MRQNYYEVVATLDIEGQQIEVVYTPKKDVEDGRILDRRYAEEKEKLIQSIPTHRVKVTRKEVYEQPPLSFNLTELQSYCSSRFGYEPTEVLNITQSLRDKHNAITYNRSDRQYLSEEQYKNAPATMETVCRNISYKPGILDMTLHSRCFDDSRISAHTAIIPQNTAVALEKITEKYRRKEAKQSTPRRAASPEATPAGRGAHPTAEREAPGKCPRCCGDVVEGKMGYGCLNDKSGCKFAIWKKPKLPMMEKVTVSKSNVRNCSEIDCDSWRRMNCSGQGGGGRRA